MKKYLKLYLTFLTIEGCVAVSAQSLAEQRSAASYRSPFEVEIFHSALSGSKLQAPTSTTVCEPENMNVCAFRFFRLSDTFDSMIFEMAGDHNRSELRQIEEWRTSTQVWRKIIGEVRFERPESPELSQCTFAQIHDSGKYPNKPLIRLVWMSRRDEVDDALWAVVRNSANANEYTWTHLSGRPDRFFQFEVKVKENVLKVKIDSQEMLQVNVSYWEDLNNYFKAGVYLQSDGTARAEYRSLKYFSE